MATRDDAAEISLGVDARRARMLHSLLLYRLNNRAETIAARDLDDDLERRIRRRLDAVEAFARDLSAPDGGAVIHVPADVERECLLRDELLDAYSAIRPDHAEDLLDADAGVGAVAAALAEHAHRHPATQNP